MEEEVLKMASSVASKKPESNFDSSSDQRPFSQQWKSSDVVLLVEGRKFHVHRTVLTLSSPVFETMFSSNFKEKSALEIPLPGKKADDFEQLNWMYPGKELSMTDNNCFALLQLATEYQIDGLKALSDKYLSDWCEEGMTVDQAIEVVVFSQKCPVECETVRSCVKRFAIQKDKGWSEMQQHSLYAELDFFNVDAIKDARIYHVEDMQGVGSSALGSSDLLEDPLPVVKRYSKRARAGKKQAERFFRSSR